MPDATVDITPRRRQDGMAQAVDQPQMNPAPPAQRLSPIQTFRLRVARNDLERVRELDMVGAETTELALMAGAVRASLLNALQIIDDLTSEERPS
jgi:hypothetical protein